MKHLVAGLILACLGIAGLVAWWPTFGMVMRGVVPFCLVAVGLVAMLSGWRSLSLAAEREERGGDSPGPSGPRRKRAAPQNEPVQSDN